MISKSLLAKNLSRYRPIWWPVLIIVAVFLSSFWVVVPRIGDIYEGQRALFSGKEELSQVTMKLEAMEGLSEYELSEKTKQVLKALPSEKNVPTSLAIIRSLAQLTDVDLLEIGVKPGDIASVSAKTQKIKKGEIPFLAFDLSISGSPDSVKNFFTKVEKIAPLTRIEKGTIDLVRSPGGASLVLDIYYLPLPKVIGSVGKPLPMLTKEENEIYSKLGDLESLPVEGSLGTIESGKENPFTY